MKKIAHLLIALCAVTGLSLVACNPTPDEPTEPVLDVTLAVNVDAVTLTSAEITVTPTPTTSSWYYSLIEKAEYTYESADAAATSIAAALATQVTAGEILWSDVLKLGQATLKFDKLSMGTEYYLLTFGLRADGTISSEAVLTEFSTLALPHYTLTIDVTKLTQNTLEVTISADQEGVSMIAVIANDRIVEANGGIDGFMDFLYNLVAEEVKAGNTTWEKELMTAPFSWGSGMMTTGSTSYIAAIAVDFEGNKTSDPVYKKVTQGAPEPEYTETTDDFVFELANITKEGLYLTVFPNEGIDAYDFWIFKDDGETFNGTPEEINDMIVANTQRTADYYWEKESANFTSYTEFVTELFYDASMYLDVTDAEYSEGYLGYALQPGDRLFIYAFGLTGNDETCVIVPTTTVNYFFYTLPTE